MRTMLLVVLVLLSGIAAADQVENQAELALLPAFCRGTQQIRAISQDPKPIEEHVAIYGKSYLALHHYCWALNSENKAMRISDTFLREATLRYALGDIQFSLDRTSPDFVFLPEMYNTRARILFKLHRDPEAVLALNKAIEAKPDYVPAYFRLSDYFVDKGNKAEAIKILEQGIDYTEKADALIKRLAKLGKAYQGVPGNKRPKDEPPEAAAPRTPQAQAEGGEEKTPAQSADQATKGPYCRFCP